MSDLFESPDLHTDVPAPRTPWLRLVGAKTQAAELDVVIPAYNEERRIGPTLVSLARTLTDAGVPARILVVDNGSVDATVELVRRTETGPVRVEVVNARLQGKGAAVRAGVQLATAPNVAYIDADQSTPPHTLVTALELLSHGWDGVIGSRRTLGGRYVVPQPVMRRMGSRAFNLAARSVVSHVSDTQCGLKVFRTTVAQQVFSRTTTPGFAFDVEVLAIAIASGLRIMELPVEWSDAPGSTFSPLRHGLVAFRDLAAVRRATRTVPVSA